MQSPANPFRRSHPILFAALIGVVFGFAQALVVEVSGAIGKNHSAVVLMLLPTDNFAPELSKNGILRTALIMSIEFAGDMLGYAILFAIPVAIFVAVRRALKPRKA